MENEMGNNNTSGFREEASTIDEEKRESVVEPVDSVPIDVNGVVNGSHEASDDGPELTGEALPQDLTSGAKDTEIHSIAEDSRVQCDSSSNEPDDHYEKAKSDLDNVTSKESNNQCVNQDMLRINSLICEDTEFHSSADDSIIKSDSSPNEPEDHYEKAESVSDNITSEASNYQHVNQDSLKIDSLICADSEIHSTAEDSTIHSDSLSNESEDHYEKGESNSGYITSEASNDQSINQDSLRIAEGEEIHQPESVTVLSNVQEIREPLQSINDKEEFSQIYTDPSLDTNINSSSESNNVLDVNGTSNGKENGYEQVETCEPSKQDNDSASVVELAQTKKINDDRLQQLVEMEEDISSNEDAYEDGSLIVTGFSAEREMPSDSPSGVGKSSTETEKTLLSQTPISSSEVSMPQNNCVVLTEEVDLIRNKLGNGDMQLSDDHISEASISESEVDEFDILQSDYSILTNNHCEQNGGVLGKPVDPDVAEVLQTDETSYPESAFSIITSNGDDHNGSEHYSEGSEGETAIVPELGGAELSFTECENDKQPRNYEHKEEAIIEKPTVGEINIKSKASYVNDESNKQVTFQLLPLQEEPYLLHNPDVLPQPQNQQESEIGIESVQCSSTPIPELNPDSCEDHIRMSASSFHTRNLTVDNLVVFVDMETEGPHKKAANNASAPEKALAESKPSPPEYQVTNRQANREVSIFARSNSVAHENLGRFSIESNPENSNNHFKIQKSPSFDFNLRRNSRSEESDRTPLLYQDKTTINQYAQCPQQLLQDQETSMDEKSATLERTDSEKSRTPFLGVTNDTKRVHAMKRDNNSTGKEAAAQEDESDSPKGKEKLKRRSSFFGTCMCCATVIN